MKHLMVKEPCPNVHCKSHQEKTCLRVHTSDCHCYPRVKAGLVKRYKNRKVVREDQRWKCNVCKQKYIETSPEKLNNLNMKGVASRLYAYQWMSVRQIACRLKISKSKAWRLIHSVSETDDDSTRVVVENASAEEERTLRKEASETGITAIPLQVFVQLRILGLWLSGEDAKQFIQDYKKYEENYGHLWKQGVRPYVITEPGRRTKTFKGKPTHKAKQKEGDEKPRNWTIQPEKINIKANRITHKQPVKPHHLGYEYTSE